MTDMKSKPKLSSGFGNQELDKAEKQIEAFDENIKQMTKDRLDQAPQKEVEPQNRLSQREIADSKDIYLKPAKSIGAREPFNENYRKDSVSFLKIKKLLAKPWNFGQNHLQEWPASFGKFLLESQFGVQDMSQNELQVANITDL